MKFSESKNSQNSHINKIVICKIMVELLWIVSRDIYTDKPLEKDIILLFKTKIKELVRFIKKKDSFYVECKIFHNVFNFANHIKRIDLEPKCEC